MLTGAEHLTVVALNRLAVALALAETAWGCCQRCSVDGSAVGLVLSTQALRCLTAEPKRKHRLCVQQHCCCRCLLATSSCRRSSCSTGARTWASCSPHRPPTFQGHTLHITDTHWRIMYADTAQALQVPARDFFLKTLFLFDGSEDVGMVLPPQAFHFPRTHTGHIKDTHWRSISADTAQALQVPARDFFLKTLFLFDGGEDVGMVLSPQAFHNLNPYADIFNHANIHFWEYMQPGYDALGFISCTGTNFLMRAQAFLEVWPCAARLDAAVKVSYCRAGFGP